MARYSDDLLDQIRRAADIVEVVGRAVPLKRTGKSWKGCCPFHQEKSPSFHVHPDSGIWKCYGCQKGGNVFMFLVEREGMSFPEAVRQIARECGIALPDDDDPQASARAARLDHLRKVMEWACRHFEKALRATDGAHGVHGAHDGERARAYFKGRGITGATAKEFRLGWAPPGWDNMIQAARRDGIPETDLLDCGLVIERDPDRSGARGFYDRYRDRVVFPIGDWQGRIIAFGARTLGDDEPKYINSPETPLYTKGRHLYALHLARQEMLRLREGAVMEGYTDVILAHQAGFKIAVAGLGTALTAEQAKALVKYAKKLYLVYDGDAAGLRAAEKAIPAFLPEDIETRVCVLPGDKDPADVFVQDGADAFRATLAQSKEAFDHLIEARAKAHDMQGVPGRSAAADECLAALVGVRDEVRRALYVKRLADEMGVPDEILSRKLTQMRRDAQGRAPDDRVPPRGPDARPQEARRPAASQPGQAAPSAPPSAPQHGSQHGSQHGASHPPPHAGEDEPEFRVSPEFLHAGDGEAHAAHDGDAHERGAAPAAPPPEPDTPASPAERGLLQALLSAPDLLAELPEDLSAALSNRATRRVIERLRTEAARTPEFDAQRFAGTCQDADEASLVAGALSSVPQGGDMPRQGRECMTTLVLAHRRRSAEARRREAEAAGDRAGADAAQRELLAIEVEIRRFRAPRTGPFRT